MADASNAFSLVRPVASWPFFWAVGPTKQISVFAHPIDISFLLHFSPLLSYQPFTVGFLSFSGVCDDTMTRCVASLH